MGVDQRGLAGTSQIDDRLGDYRRVAANLLYRRIGIGCDAPHRLADGRRHGDNHAFGANRYSRDLFYLPSQTAQGDGVLNFIIKFSLKYEG